ncbi:MAG TPA: RiPP maturation radical SAM C-methyltransferase [Sphingobacteriaceae bacterium]
MNHESTSLDIDVLLISMPFSPTQPSIGLGILKAGLAKNNVSAKILYYTLSFAKLIGAQLYNRIASGYPATVDQVGEWLFSKALFPDVDNTDEYIQSVVMGQDPAHQSTNPAVPKDVPESFIQQILHVRSLVDEFLYNCLEDVSHYRPKIVGFTSTFQQHVASLALAQRIKQKYPEIRIIFGGANCEGVMGIETLRQFPFVDMIVSGEGDRVFPEIVQRILIGKSILGIQGVYIRGDICTLSMSMSYLNAESFSHMDDVPIPDYSDFFEQKAALGLDFTPLLLFETSRGCWYGAKHHCTFCGLNDLTLGFRSKSSARALTELMTLTTSYPGCPVVTVDNILDMNYFQTFIRELALRPIEVQIFYEVKANLKKEQLRLLKGARVTRIQPGIESLSSVILAMMRKGVKALQNIQLLKWCKEFDIYPTWNLLWGFPGEPTAEYGAMSELIALITHLTPPEDVTKIRLDRFSPNFERPNQFGVTGIKAYPSYSYIYSGVADTSIQHLAYYFVFDDPSHSISQGYIGELAKRVMLWRKTHARSELYVSYKDADVLIWDFRPGAKTLLTRLSGLEQELYLACDAIQSVDHLATIATKYVGGISRKDTSTLLQGFIDRGLMLREGNNYLSLAVWLDQNKPKAASLEAMYKVLEASGKLPPRYTTTVHH